MAGTEHVLYGFIMALAKKTAKPYKATSIPASLSLLCPTAALLVSPFTSFSSPSTVKMEGRRSNRSIDTKPARRPFIIDSVSARGKLPTYDGLRDVNLRAYFSNKGRRKVLVKAGLVRST